METETILYPMQHSFSSKPFPFPDLRFETPLTALSIRSDWPPFIAECDYQMENGRMPVMPDPLPSPAALSFAQLATELDRERIHNKMTPQSFHPFSNLPTELRQYIWSLASQQQRNVNIWFNALLLTYRTNTPGPSLLYACREAREIALKHYSLSFGTKHTTSWFTFTTRSRIWCNLNVDTICLTSKFHPGHPNRYEDFFAKCAQTNMRSLAYNIHQFFSYRGYTGGVNWSMIFRIVDAYGDRSSELREIVLYYDGDEDFTSHSSVRTEFVDLDWSAMDPECHKIRALQDVQRDLLREFPEQAEVVEQGRDKERAARIWGDIQAKVKFMDVKVHMEG